MATKRKKRVLDAVMGAADERRYWRNKAAHAALEGNAKAAAKYLRYASEAPCSSEAPPKSSPMPAKPAASKSKPKKKGRRK